jgi:hypothetical protein
MPVPVVTLTLTDFGSATRVMRTLLASCERHL